MGGRSGTKGQDLPGQPMVGVQGGMASGPGEAFARSGHMSRCRPGEGPCQSLFPSPSQPCPLLSLYPGHSLWPEVPSHWGLAGWHLCSQALAPTRQDVPGNASSLHCWRRARQPGRQGHALSVTRAGVRAPHRVRSEGGGAHLCKCGPTGEGPGVAWSQRWMEGRGGLTWARSIL